MIFKLRPERHLSGTANTYTQICPQVVFVVEGRHNPIPAEQSDERSCWKDSAPLTTSDASIKRVMNADRRTCRLLRGLSCFGFGFYNDCAPDGAGRDEGYGRMMYDDRFLSVDSCNRAKVVAEVWRRSGFDGKISASLPPRLLLVDSARLSPES
jgi:hypothetical protein